MRRKLLASVTALVLAGVSVAHAQLLPAPQGNYYESPAKFATYSAVFVSTTTAASLTDFFTINGSATKTIYVKRLGCSGNSTAAGSGTIALVRRSTADSGGTKVTASATVGGQLVPLDSNSAAATATVNAYTANPTTGTAVGIVNAASLNTGPAATAASSPELTWTFGGGDNTQAQTLRGAAQGLSVSGLGTALPAGTTVTCEVLWTEGQ